MALLRINLYSSFRNTINYNFIKCRTKCSNRARSYKNISPWDLKNITSNARPINSFLKVNYSVTYYRYHRLIDDNADGERVMVGVPNVAENADVVYFTCCVGTLRPQV